MTDFPHLVLVLFSTLRRYWPDFDGNLIGQMSCIKLSLTSNPPGLILLRFAEELGETDPNQLRFLRVMKIARALRGVRVMRLLRYVSSLRAILFSISSTLCRLEMSVSRNKGISVRDRSRNETPKKHVSSQDDAKSFFFQTWFIWGTLGSLFWTLVLLQILFYCFGLLVAQNLSWTRSTERKSISSTENLFFV